MVKSIIYVLITAAIIVGFSFLENYTLKKNFGELSQEIAVIKEKADENILSGNDLKIFQDKWIKAKEVLHIYIPHNDIKEIDLWISECVHYAKEKDFGEVKAKAEVIAELFEQIPKTFSIKIENIM